jgi:hypothetical protein
MTIAARIARSCGRRIAEGIGRLLVDKVESALEQEATRLADRLVDEIRSAATGEHSKKEQGERSR